MCSTKRARSPKRVPCTHSTLPSTSRRPPNPSGSLAPTCALRPRACHSRRRATDAATAARRGCRPSKAKKRATSNRRPPLRSMLRQLSSRPCLSRQKSGLGPVLCLRRIIIQACSRGDLHAPLTHLMSATDPAQAPLMQAERRPTPPFDNVGRRPRLAEPPHPAHSEAATPGAGSDVRDLHSPHAVSWLASGLALLGRVCSGNEPQSPQAPTGVSAHRMPWGYGGPAPLCTADPGCQRRPGPGHGQ